MNRIVRGLAAAFLFLPSTAGATPLLSEVFYDAVGSDDGKVFVEISGAAGTDLSGHSIEGVNGADGSVTVSIALTGTIGASGLFVLADHDAAGASLVVGFDQLADFDFQNGPDSVVLRSGASVLDAVGYGSFPAGSFFAGEGAATSDPTAGNSVARHFADRDTNDNATDWLAGAPTPATASFVPEPELALLLGIALGVPALRRRRHARPAC